MLFRGRIRAGRQAAKLSLKFWGFARKVPIGASADTLPRDGSSSAGTGPHDFVGLLFPLDLNGLDTKLLEMLPQFFF
jgi:hypothetical protein